MVGKVKLHSVLPSAHGGNLIQTYRRTIELSLRIGGDPDHRQGRDGDDERRKCARL
jgi:hypothetical protein